MSIKAAKVETNIIFLISMVDLHNKISISSKKSPKKFLFLFSAARPILDYSNKILIGARVVQISKKF